MVSGWAVRKERGNDGGSEAGEVQASCDSCQLSSHSLTLLRKALETMLHPRALSHGGISVSSLALRFEKYA